MKRLAAPTLALSAVVFLASCGSDEQAPVAPPAGTAQVVSVTPCLEQVVPGTGTRVVDLVLPDTITVNLAQPSGYPNGRRLQDPVVDITLAVIFLDMNRHGPNTFANLPLNPAANDRPFRTEFPFLALPQGAPPRSGSDTATAFDFVDAPASQYVRVDRMGMPAVATVLVASSRRNEYNDAGPGEDAAFVFASELTSQLQGLQEVLLDDFRAAGLTTCAAVR
jgi:Domain of unknown function (DUF4331)